MRTSGLQQRARTPQKYLGQVFIRHIQQGESHNNYSVTLLYLTVRKYLYSSEILLIASLAFAKASITFLLIAITPQRNVLLACYVLLGVVALWAVTSIFATAFQCDLPRPWDSDPGRCINQQALLVFIGIINIVTDVAVIPISFFLTRNIQVSPFKRWQVIGLFTIRIM